MNADAFVTAVTNANCLTTVPVGTRLHNLYGLLRRDYNSMVVDGWCSVAVKKLDTDCSKHTCTIVHVWTLCRHIRTQTHTPLCSHGLRTGPTEGLSSWSLSDSQRRQHLLITYHGELLSCRRSGTTVTRAM